MHQDTTLHNAAEITIHLHAFTYIQHEVVLTRTFITYDTLAACTSPPVLNLPCTPPVPRGTWARAASSSAPCRTSHCSRSSQTMESACRGWCLQSRSRSVTHTHSQLQITWCGQIKLTHLDWQEMDQVKFVPKFTAGKKNMLKKQNVLLDFGEFTITQLCLNAITLLYRTIVRRDVLLKKSPTHDILASCSSPLPAPLPHKWNHLEEASSPCALSSSCRDHKWHCRRPTRPTL